MGICPTGEEKPVDAFNGKYDADQLKMMEERVIQLDKDDNVIGGATKKESHLLDVNNKSMLHRAFSVFLFSPDRKKLLLQKRSADKITFPSYWANTCCSHPLFDLPVDEKGGADGVIIAARRKLEQELGITPEQVPTECFTFLTRVHYQSPCCDTWGEHEIDYILICRPDKDVVVKPNPNEVAEARWLDVEEMKTFMAKNALPDQGTELVSPWYRIIHDMFLYKWWDSIDDLETFKDPETIHRAEGAEWALVEGATDPFVSSK